MPPRRHRANLEMEEEMRCLKMQLDSMEIAQRREKDVGDISEGEIEENVVEEIALIEICFKNRSQRKNRGTNV
jgi:hypothetical protein